MSVKRIIIERDTIGDRIRKYRLEKGLTQRELAEKCRMFDSAIRRYELGTQNPKKETLEKIAAALEIPSAALLLPDILTNEKIKKAIEDAAASVGENSTQVSTSINPVDIDKIADSISKSLYAGASAISEEERLSITFHDMPDKPVKEMTHEETARAVNMFPEALATFCSELLSAFAKLNSEGRAEAIKRVEELTQIPKYTTPDDTDKEET